MLIRSSDHYFNNWGVHSVGFEFFEVFKDISTMCCSQMLKLQLWAASHRRHIMYGTKTYTLFSQRWILSIQIYEKRSSLGNIHPNCRYCLNTRWWQAKGKVGPGIPLCLHKKYFTWHLENKPETGSIVMLYFMTFCCQKTDAAADQCGYSSTLQNGCWKPPTVLCPNRTVE